MQALYETTVVEAELSQKAKLSICSPSSTVWSFGQWAAERMSSLIKVSEISSLYGLTGINLDVPHLRTIPGLSFHHRLILYTKTSVYSPLKNTSRLHPATTRALLYLEKGFKYGVTKAKWFLRWRIYWRKIHLCILIYYHQSVCTLLWGLFNEKSDQNWMVKC